MTKKTLSGILCALVLAAAIIALPANASVPPPGPKLKCRTAYGASPWGYVKILPERRYWASDSVWAGEGKGSGRLRPLKRRSFKVVSGPLRGMKGRWFYLEPGKVAIRWYFGGDSSGYTDITCGPR